MDVVASRRRRFFEDTKRAYEKYEFARAADFVCELANDEQLMTRSAKAGFSGYACGHQKINFLFYLLRMMKTSDFKFDAATARCFVEIFSTFYPMFQHQESGVDVFADYHLKSLEVLN